MSYQPGDRVTYRGEKAIVATTHADGTVNVVHGTDWSNAADGPWPVAPEAGVSGDDLIDGWPDDEDDEDTVEATATTAPSESTTTSTTADVEPEPVDEDDGDDDEEPEAEGESEPDEADDMPEGGDVDVEAFLDRNIPEIENDVASGDYDHALDEIEVAEIDGEDRVGVADAIASRRSEIEE